MNSPGFLLAFEDVEFVTGVRGTVQSEDGDRSRGAGLLQGLAALVGHGADLAAVLTGQHGVAYAERAGGDDEVGHVSTAFVKAGFDDGADRALLRIGLEFEQLGFEGDLFQQFGDAHAGLG